MNDAVILALIGIISAMVGVVIWLVKTQTQTAKKAQETLTTSLQQTITNQRDQIQTYAKGFSQLTDTMQTGFNAMAKGREDASGKLMEQGSQIMRQLDSHKKQLDDIAANISKDSAA
jgi:uncharacterized membrane-anchored protein YhcB (DUF1043 family)